MVREKRAGLQTSEDTSCSSRPALLSQSLMIDEGVVPSIQIPLSRGSLALTYESTRKSGSTPLSSRGARWSSSALRFRLREALSGSTVRDRHQSPL